MIKRFLERFNIVKTVYHKLYGGYTRSVILLIVIGFLGGLLEGVGIGLLIPLFSLVSHQSQDDKITQFVKSIFDFFHFDFRISSLLILVALLFTLKAVFVFIFNYIVARITVNYDFEMKNNLYSAFLHTNWLAILKQKIGHLENYLSNHIASTIKLLAQLSDLVLFGTSFIVYLLFSLRIAFSTTILALVLGASLLIIFRPLMSRTKKYSREMVNIMRSIPHHVSENFLGMKTIKSLNEEEAVAKAGSELFRQVRQIRLKMHLVKHIAYESTEPISIIFISVVFTYAFLQPGFSLGVFVAVVYLIQRIFNYIGKLQRELLALNDSIPYALSLIEYRDLLKKNQELNKGSIPFSFKDRIVLEHLTFSYGQGKTIEDVSFEIKKGEMVGIIGPSGSGKSTVVDILLRLFIPTGGQILVDGKNYLDISLPDWRRHIGYVAQDIFLKNDTILENIRFYDKSITDQRVNIAVREVGLADFLKSLPNGLETLIGDRGLLLSFGQRQRISLARVLVRNPEILILDEATASLDNESELLIKKAIESLHGKITVIMIAHRLSTVMDADNLIVLDKGKVMEMGRPDKLLDNPYSYFSRVKNLI